MPGHATTLEQVFDEIDRTWDFQPLIERLAEHVVLRITIPDGTPMSGEFRGKPAVSEYFMTTLPNIARFEQQEPMEFIEDGERVVVLGDDAYTLIKTGERFRSPYAIVVDFSADLIDRILIIQDLSGLYEAYRPSTSPRRADAADAARSRAARAKPRILAISGSIRTDSVNTQLLRAAAELNADDLDVIIWDELAQIPPFTPDAESRPESVRSFRAAIAASDALLISSPEYNFSVPGQLKNAIDWASHPIADSPFAGKPTAVIGASSDPTSEASWARTDLRRILQVVGARVVERDLVVLRADEAFAANGRLREHEQELLDVLRELRSAVADRPFSDDLRLPAATSTERAS